MSNVDALYVIVNKENGKIYRHMSKGSMAVFASEEMAEKHAWRYGAKDDNYNIVKYTPEEV